MQGGGIDTLQVDTASGEKPGEIDEVIAIGGKGQPRRAALGRQHLEKRLETRRYRDRFVPLTSGSAHRAIPFRPAPAARRNSNRRGTDSRQPLLTSPPKRGPGTPFPYLTSRS